MGVIYRYRLNMTPGGVPLVVHVNQYDEMFTLIFDLYALVNGTQFTIPEDTTAMVQGTKTDGCAYDADCYLDRETKQVTVDGDPQMTASAGKNIFEIKLINDGRALYSANFILDVEPAAMDANSIQDESVLKELNAIIESAATATAAAETATEAAESVSESAAQIALNKAAVERLDYNLADYNCVNLLDNVTPKNDRTHKGITFHWTDATNCEVEGTSTDTAFYPLFSNTAGFPDWLEKGGTYSIKYSTTDALITLIIWYYRGGSYSEGYTVKGDYVWTIPDDVDGLILRLQVAKNKTVDGTVTVSLLNTKTNAELAAENAVITDRIGDVEDEITGIEAGSDPLTRTVKDTLVSMVDAAPFEPLTMVADLTARQSGSGVPSASNIRTLYGWTSVKFIKCGKNIFIRGVDQAQTINGITFTPNSDGSVSAVGTASSSAAFNIRTQFFMPPGKYHISGCPAGGSPTTYELLVEYGGAKYRDYGDGFVLTVNKNDMRITMVQLVIRSGQTVDITYWPMWTADGYGDETYEPYKSDEPTMYFPAGAGTVYGGTYDFNTGVLTVTHGQIASYAGETLPGKWVSDRDVYAPGTTPTTGAQVVYELAEPVEYGATKRTTTLYEGINNIFACAKSTDDKFYSTGDMEIEYRRKMNLYAEDVESKINGVSDQESADADALAIKGSVSGNTAHFPDGIENGKVKAFKINVVPTQEGSGTPSAQNHRTIVGSSTITIRQNGKNLLPRYYSGTHESNGVTFTALPDGKVIANGTVPDVENMAATWNLRRNFYMPVGRYILSGCAGIGRPSSYEIFIEINGEKYRDRGRGGVEFEITDPTTLITCVQIVIRRNQTVNNIVFEPMLRPAGILDGTHEPYVERNYALNIADVTYGDVYSGTVDAVTGSVRSVQGLISSYNGEELSGRWISDRDVYDPEGTPTTGAQVFDFGASAVGYEVAPIEIRTFKGYNFFYCESGTLEVNYKADTKIYVDNPADPLAPPAYYFENNYLPDKVETIRQAMEAAEGNYDAFIFCTDQHWKMNAQQSPKLINYLSNELCLPRMFMGGDYEDGLAPFAYKPYRDAYRGKIYDVIGNHEYFNQVTTETDYYVRSITNSTLFTFLLGNLTDAVFPDPVDSYYYVDNTVQKMRYIILRTFTDSGDKGQIYFPDGEKTWIRDVALGTMPAGYTAVFFGHGLAAATKYTDEFDLFASTGEPLAEITDAYAGDGEIACYICGHTHYDGQGETPGGTPVFVTTSDKYMPFPGDNEDYLSERHTGTINEQAFDVFVIDKTNRLITAVRIGCQAYSADGRKEVRTAEY